MNEHRKIIIEGLIWKREDYFPCKKIEMQKNNVFNKFYFFRTFFLIAAHEILQNDEILINRKSFYQETESPQPYLSQFSEKNSLMAETIKNQFSKKILINELLNLVIIHPFQKIGNF